MFPLLSLRLDGVANSQVRGHHGLQREVIRVYSDALLVPQRTEVIWVAWEESFLPC